MIKTCITVGVDEVGKQCCLYLGPDAVAARDMFENPGVGIVETLFFKRPHPTKRRRGHGASAIEDDGGDSSEAEDAKGETPSATGEKPVLPKVRKGRK